MDPRRSARLCVALCALAVPGLSAAETVAVYAGRLIADPATGLGGPATIVEEDGTITTVTPGRVPQPAGVRVVDLGDATVLPGLIDLHTHLTGDPGSDYRDEAVQGAEHEMMVGAKNARLTVRAGFTTVRNVGSGRLAGIELGRATADGLIPGPRVIASGPAISIIGGHGDVSGFRPEVLSAIAAGNTCTGVDQCTAVVRSQARDGAQVIKFTATGGVLSQQARGLDAHFTDAEMKAIVDTAHSLGLKAAAHAHGARGIEAASRAGVDSIEHGTFADDAALDQMKRTGSVLVPTLMAYTGIRERLGTGVFTPAVEVKVRQTLSLVGQAAKAARAKGVPVVFGTDAAVFEHGRNAEEFALLVQLVGMTPAEAVASATTEAAKVLDMEDRLGRVAPGYSADLIAVDGDPLTNVAILQDVRFVMASGRIVKGDGQ